MRPPWRESNLKTRGSSECEIAQQRGLRGGEPSFPVNVTRHERIKHDIRQLETRTWRDHDIAERLENTICVHVVVSAS